MISESNLVNLTGVTLKPGQRTIKLEAVIFPFDSTKILEINPSVGSALEISSVSANLNKYRGGILADNGKIYTVPYNETVSMEIALYDGVITHEGDLQNFNKDTLISGYLNKF